MTSDDFRKLVLERLPAGHAVDLRSAGDAAHRVEITELATSRKFEMLVEGAKLARPRESEAVLNELVAGARAAFVA